MTKIKLGQALALLVPLSLALVPRAQAHDELYYSAAACVPYKGTNWNGNGSAGFQFTNVGTWNNYDRDETQILICPVPYFRNAADLAPIVARVVIDDYNPDVFSRAFLCARDSDSPAQHCVNDDNFPTVYGNSMIELTLTPSAADRFVWLEVHIPADVEDNNPYSNNGTSGLIGYRIFRN